MSPTKKTTHKKSNLPNKSVPQLNKIANMLISVDSFVKMFMLLQYKWVIVTIVVIYLLISQVNWNKIVCVTSLMVQHTGYCTSYCPEKTRNDNED